MAAKQELTEPQEAFVFSEAVHPAFVGGFGAGKTEAGLVRAFVLALKYKGRVGLFAPSYDLVRTNFFGRVEAKAEEWGLRGRLNKSENSFTFNRGGQILFRTMDNPDRIVGYELTDAILDELDTLPEDKAAEVWNKVIGRCRTPKYDERPNTIGTTTTPEGYRFVYRMWGIEPREGFELIRAPTYSNPTLREDYLNNLRANYPAQLLAAYMEGEFCNLENGSVYPAFNRELNGSSETIIPGEPLYIGMDFNVGNCTAIVLVSRNGWPHAVREFTRVADTPEMCQKLREAFPGHPISIYPDAAGRHKSSTDASNSDLQILQNAGFKLVLHQNEKGQYYQPKVKDRVAAVNALILDGAGRRRLRVNTKLCPELTQCLEQQVYDKHGEPDKTGNKDHANDALGYFVELTFPVVKPVATRTAYSNHMQR